METTIQNNYASCIATRDLRVGDVLFVTQPTPWATRCLQVQGLQVRELIHSFLNKKDQAGFDEAVETAVRSLTTTTSIASSESKITTSPTSTEIELKVPRSSYPKLLTHLSSIVLAAKIAVAMEKKQVLYRRRFPNCPWPEMDEEMETNFILSEPRPLNVYDSVPESLGQTQPQTQTKMKNKNAWLNLSEETIRKEIKFIFKTFGVTLTLPFNAFAVCLAKVAHHVLKVPTFTAVWLKEMSFINHSCVPNVGWSWACFPSQPKSLKGSRKERKTKDKDKDKEQKNETVQIKLVAIRNIAKGEEICLNYCDDCLPDNTANRRRFVYEQQGFLCQCQFCMETLPSKPRPFVKRPFPCDIWQPPVTSLFCWYCGHGIQENYLQSGVKEWISSQLLHNLETSFEEVQVPSKFIHRKLQECKECGKAKFCSSKCELQHLEMGGHLCGDPPNLSLDKDSDKDSEHLDKDIDRDLKDLPHLKDFVQEKQTDATGFVELQLRCGLDGVWKSDFERHPYMKSTFKIQKYSCSIVRSKSGFYVASVSLPLLHPFAFKSLEQVNTKLSVHGGLSDLKGGVLEFHCGHRDDIIPWDHKILSRAGIMLPNQTYGEYRDYEFVLSEIFKIIQTCNSQ